MGVSGGGRVLGRAMGRRRHPREGGSGGTGSDGSAGRCRGGATRCRHVVAKMKSWHRGG